MRHSIVSLLFVFATACSGAVTRTQATPLHSSETISEPVRPIIVGQHSHSYEVLSGAISTDGAIAVTATNSEVFVWSTELGKQIRQFKGVWRFALSPDGQSILLFWNRELRLCALGTAQCSHLSPLPALTDNFWIDDHPGFSASGHHAWMTRGQLGESFILRTHDGAMTQLPAGSYAIVATDSTDGTVTAYVVHLRDETLYRYTWPKGIVESKPTLQRVAKLPRWNVDSHALSSDGRLLLLGYEYNNSLLLDTSKTDAIVELAASRSKSATFSGHKPRIVTEDKSLLTFDEHGVLESRQVGVVAVNGGSVLFNDFSITTPSAVTRKLTTRDFVPNILVGSDDGRRLLVAVNGKTWQWDLLDPRGAQRIDKGDEVLAIESVFGSNAASSEDNLVAIQARAGLKLWNPDSGEYTSFADSAAPSKSPEEQRPFVYSSLDHKTILQAYGRTAKVWSAGTAEPTRLMLPPPLSANDPDDLVVASFSPSGRLLATGSGRGVVCVWDLARARLVARIDHSSGVNHLSFVDEDRFIVGLADSTNSAGAVVRRLVATAPPVIERAMGRAMFAANRAATRFLVDDAVVDASGRRLWSLPVEAPAAAALSPDGERAAILETDHSSVTHTEWAIHIYSHSGYRAAVPIDQTRISDLTFFGPSMLRYTDVDGVIHLWRICDSSAECKTIPHKLCEIHPTAEGWVSIDDSARYDTSDFAGLEDLVWLFSDRTVSAVPADMFMHDYYVPGLVSRLAFPSSRPDRALPSPPDLRTVDRSVPRVTIDSAVPLACADRCSTPGAEVRLTVYSNARYARNLQVLRDGNLAAEVGSIPLDQNGRAVVLLRIPLSAKATNTTLTAYAFNGSQLKGPTYRHLYHYTSVTTTSLPRAIIVSIGVGNSGTELASLVWSPKDAATMLDLLESSLRREYRPVKMAVTSELACPPTRHNILDGLSKISGASSTDAPCRFGDVEPARPDDVVFVYISAHGVNDGKELSVIAEGGERVLSSELAAAMRSIQSDHIVVILDTCDSEAAVRSAGFRPAPLGDSTFGQLAFDKAMTVLTASGQYEDAIANQQAGGSLLVSALRDTLSHAPGRTMPVRDLLSSAISGVKALFKMHAISGQVQRPVMFDYHRGSNDIVLRLP